MPGKAYREFLEHIRSECDALKEELKDLDKEDLREFSFVRGKYFEACYLLFVCEDFAIDDDGDGYGR